jgi:hypothetical protein
MFENVQIWYDWSEDAPSRATGVLMTKANAALATLLARAEGADPAHRIDLRDPIAAHGAAAIEAVVPWLKDPALAAFAIRVIARVGLDGERETAQAALRAARRRMDDRIRADADWALGVLKLAPTPAPEPAVVRRAAAPRRAEEPRYSAAGSRPLRSRPRSGLSPS